MYLAYATSPLNPLVTPSGRVRSHEGLQKIYSQNVKKENKEKRNKKRKMKMTKHNVYIRVNCTRLDQPKPHSDSSISLYTSIICISGYIIPKNGFRTSAFYPTTHENIEFILVPNVQVYHHPKTLAYRNQTQSHLTNTSYLIDFASMKNELPQWQYCLKG